MFQSLIGTVQQNVLNNGGAVAINMFQSLIGTVQPKDDADVLKAIQEFQSLIGTVQLFVSNGDTAI